MRSDWELCKLLGELGVDYVRDVVLAGVRVRWKDARGRMVRALIHDSGLVELTSFVTPTQAVDVTVGKGERDERNGEEDMTSKEIESRFSYHAPRGDQPERYERIRAAARDLAGLVDEACPDSREKSLAMTRLEECVMWANSSIARNESD